MTALDEDTRYSVALVKAFFEELIGCVVGCGCWTDLVPQWDDPSRLRAFARDGFKSGAREDSVDDVAFALEWCFAKISEDNLAELRQELELHFDTREEFREFFATAHAVLTTR